MTKHCKGCDTIKPVEEFGKNSAKSDGLQTQCSECRKKYHKRHYQANKQYYLDKNNRIRRRNRRFLLNYLSQHGCVDCPETDPVVLTFDHVRDKKEFNVCEAVNRCFALSVIEKEIMKCEVRCCNCHARKTAEDYGWYAGFIQHKDLL